MDLCDDIFSDGAHYVPSLDAWYDADDYALGIEELLAEAPGKDSGDCFAACAAAAANAEAHASASAKAGSGSGAETETETETETATETATSSDPAAAAAAAAAADAAAATVAASPLEPHVRYLARVVTQLATGVDPGAAAADAVRPVPRRDAGDARSCAPLELMASVAHAAVLTVNALAGQAGGDGTELFDAPGVEVMAIPAATEAILRLVGSPLGNTALVNAEMVTCVALIVMGKWITDRSLHTAVVPGAIGVPSEKVWSCEADFLRALEFDVAVDDDAVELHTMAAIGATWW